MTDNNFLTPVGRLVQGSLYKPNETDMEGRPLVGKNGQPRVQYYVGIAFEKSNPETVELVDSIQAYVVSLYPAGISANFAWKMVDGDQPDPIKGVNENLKGHVLLKLTNGYAPTVWDKECESKKTDVKKGDYVRAQITVTSNGSAQKPGVFLNINTVQHVAYGTEIKSGPDVKSLFKRPITGVPTGASNIPSAPSVAPQAVVQTASAVHPFLRKPV